MLSKPPRDNYELLYLNIQRCRNRAYPQASLAPMGEYFYRERDSTIGTILLCVNTRRGGQ